MYKKIIALMLALVMVVALLPNAAFAAAGGVAEPVADDDTACGSPSSDDTQPPEGQAEERDPADPDGEEISDSAYSIAPDAEPAPEDGDGSDGSDLGIAPIAIDPGEANAERVKAYFAGNNFIGTYVTGRHEDGKSYEKWSIVIAEGGDVALWYDGIDTGTTVTKFNEVDSTGKPKSIEFSHEGWYTDETTETNQTLTVTLDGNNYFTMPDQNIYWAKDGTGETFSFSKAPHYYNETILKAHFKDYAGEYTLNDGSGWKLNISTDGEFTMSGTGAEKAFVDYFTMNSSRKTFNAVVFASPDWYSSGSKKAPYQTLQLNWTAETSSKAYNFFKPSKQLMFYGSNGTTVLKGFNKYSYFMPADGMYSFKYFAGQNEDGSYKYAGNYALSNAYHVAYGDVIGDWYIEIKENGHVYLHAGDEQREAVATAGSTGPDRVTTMYVCVPDRYTDKACTIPAFIKLTWVNNSTAKAADMYFTTTVATSTKTDPEVTEAYKHGEGGKAVKTFIPPMHFAHSDRTAFAMKKLSAVGDDGKYLYVNKYVVNDESGEYIEIKDDGSVVLHTGDKDYTPLYYNIDANWIKKPDDADVTSVVFSTPDWFGAANQKSVENDRQTVTMTWNATNLQFTAEEKTCYKEDSDEVVRTYTANTKYNTEESLKEAAAYFDQYVEGEYTLNDGSGWKIKVAEDAEKGWTIYIDFDGDENEDYEPVENPAPVFAFDKSHTAASNTDTKINEWGNDGRYLSTITVPVPYWYTDEECTRDAIVTLTWNGELTNPIDDHQFNVAPIALYREKDGDVECKYMAGTFYSDEDRAKGEAFLKSINVAGTYQPTAAEGKWWIDISDEGKVTIHVTDSRNNEHTYEDVAMDLTINKSIKKHNNPDFGKVDAVPDIKIVIPEWRTAGTNDTLENITKCGEVTFTFTRDQTYVASSYFTPSNTYIYDDADEDGNPWEVKTKSSQPGYNKPLNTKIYNSDRAYTDANKDAAKAYFKAYAGTYYIEEAGLGYKLTITEEGEIYWGDYASGKASLPADVAFDAIHDADGDGKVGDDETTPVPETISVWLNGYSTGTYSSSTKDPFYTDGIQRANLTWNDTDEEGIANSAHKFKTSGTSVKGHLAGAKETITFALDKYYTRGDEVAAKDFVKDGTYETTDGEWKIVIETDETTGETSYTFYRPDVKTEYPLKLFGTGNAAYLRGKIGMMKKNDVYIVVTKGPYEGFLLTAYEVTYNDLRGKEMNSSSAPTVTLPLGTRFTDYALGDTGENKNIIVAEVGQSKEDGERYSRLALALHNVKDGGTIYLEDDIKVGFAAKLPDGVGEVTIDGQGHTVSRDSYVNPGTLIMDPKMGENEAVMSILMDPGISLMALEEEGKEGTMPEEHYTGAILQVGDDDTVTLKDVTIDGEGNWEFDEEKLEYDKQLNKSYDVNVLDDPNGGHPIKELEGNVVSTDSLIKVNGGTLILDSVILENFFAGDGYDDDRHFIDFMSAEHGELKIVSNTVFKHNASRSGVCIGNTDEDDIDLNGFTTMEDNYCFGGNGGLVVAMEGTQVYMKDGTKIINNVAADTNGIFIQLHKKTDGPKDGDNKGDVYSKLHMDGGEIGYNTGLRGGSYGWGQTIYLYNGGSFNMNGGSIHDNIGAGISSIYQQPSADALMLNAGKIYNNTCSLRDEGTDWALDIALMNIGTMGEKMEINQNFVVGAAAILGGYASGDEYLTNNGVIRGNISVYSYFNNEGRVTTVVNNNKIEGNIRLENGSMIKNSEEGEITGNVTVRGSLTDSAGESSFHNEGKVDGDVELAEGAHLYNSGEIKGNVTVKSGGVLELNCNDPNHKLHGGTIDGDVTVYPGGLLYADPLAKPTHVDGTITFEYENEEDRKRMEDVLRDSGITCEHVEYKQHAHSEKLDEEVIEPESRAGNDYRCTDPWTKEYTCQTCGEVVKTEQIEPTGHEYYVSETSEATCTEGAIETIRCKNCSAFPSSGSNRLKRQVGKPLGHHYVELTQLYIPPTDYGTGHIYYVCTECGDLLEFEIDEVHDGNTKHTFQDEDGALIESAGKVTKDPTCTTDGEMTFECDQCHTTITITIPATGHKYPLEADNFAEDCEEIDREESTCTTAGYIKYAAVCESCGQQSDDYKYQVNLRKLEHNWSEWKNVDETIQYPCTMEREQERYCESCGLTETRIDSEKAHAWEDQTDDGRLQRCTVCGTYQGGVYVEYDVNGGAATESLNAQMRLTHEPGENDVELWQPTDEADDKITGITGGKWTKSTALGNAVFVGWSTVDYGAEPFYNDVPVDLEGNIVTTVDIDAENPQDVPVYAVWALDRNGNDIADYKENKVTLEYDLNGGSGEVPAKMENLLIGASYPLVTVCDLKKGDDVFAGWSRNKTDDVIPRDGVTIDIATDDADAPVSRVTWTDASGAEKSVDLLTSPYKIPTPADGNTVTLYAVYAVADSVGRPAFDDGYYHVEYYAPGADPNRDYTVAEDGLFYTCNDHHKPNTWADLMTTLDASVMVYRRGAVLVGWTADEEWKDADHDFIEREAEESVLIETVEIPEHDNAKVYAVWAVDSNFNGIRDYHERQLTHTYYLNERLLDHSAGDKYTLPLQDESGKHISESYLRISEENEKKLPAAVHNVLVGHQIPFPGENIAFEDSNLIKEADLYSLDGKTVLHHYIQIGWSGYPHTDAQSEGEAKAWIIGYDLKDDPDHPGQKKDNNGYLDKDGIFHREIKDERSINAYVVWALDDNKNGIADFREYTVTLELDGGTGGDDFDPTTDLQKGETFTFPADPTKDGFTFLGWSADGDTKLYKAGDKIEVTSDLTFTAQWKENPTTEKRYTVTLDVNGGTGGDDFRQKTEIRDGETFTFPADPTKDGFTFTGWSADGDTKLYKAGDKIEVTSDLTFTAQWKENPTTEKRYTVTLDVNGGTGGDDFRQKTEIRDGETFAFPADPTKDGFTFTGWSADGDTKLYKTGDKIEVTSDLTFTAQWKENPTTEKRYTVTLDVNGGTGGDDFRQKTEIRDGETFTFPADPTKDGFTFLGWSADGDTKLYKAGDKIEVTSDITFTAQWEKVGTGDPTTEKRYTVTLDVNGGTGGDDFRQKTEIKDGETFTFPTDPTKGGFTFTGWSADGDTKLYKAGDKIEVASDLTFTAQWKEAGTGSGGSTGGDDPGSVPDGGSPSESTVCDGGVNCPSRDYIDVDQSKWYHESVDYVILARLMLGRDEYVFDPDGITTRAEMVTILYRLEGAPAVTMQIPFDDVPTGKWYSDAINWAAAHEIVLGYGNGKFGPGDTITREQMAAILYRYATYKGYNTTNLGDLSAYTDADTISDWAETAMRWAVSEGIIEGTSDTTFSPSDDSTRAQVATIFMRFCKKIKK